MKETLDFQILKNKKPSPDGEGFLFHVDCIETVGG